MQLHSYALESVAKLEQAYRVSLDLLYSRFYTFYREKYFSTGMNKYS